MNELKPRSAEQATCSANAELAEIDVMRALECCGKGTKDDCRNCPCFNSEIILTTDCMERLIRNALALLREKDAEIERLQKHNTKMARKHYQDGRADAITEFAQRVKASLNDMARWQMHGDENEYFIIGKPFIDEIAKEMKEEQDGR